VAVATGPGEAAVVARIRTIKPEFWTDDAITECSLSARLLFIGVWNFADDAGNLDRSSKQLKARIFPVDNIDCEPLIQELITHGLLREYSVSGKKYLHIPGFIDHQVINRPSKPVVPGPAEEVNTPTPLTEPSVSTHPGREGKGKEGKGVRKPRKSKDQIPFPDDFTLTDGLRAYAADRLPDANVPALFDQFRENCKAKNRTYTDWPAAWRTWVGNCAPGSGSFADGKYPRMGGRKVATVKIGDREWAV